MDVVTSPLQVDTMDMQPRSNQESNPMKDSDLQTILHTWNSTGIACDLDNVSQVAMLRGLQPQRGYPSCCSIAYYI